MKKPLPKRFYDQVGVRETGDGFVIELDGKPLKTPARAALPAPRRHWPSWWQPNGRPRTR